MSGPPLGFSAKLVRIAYRFRVLRMKIVSPRPERTIRIHNGCHFWSPIRKFRNSCFPPAAPPLDHAAGFPAHGPNCNVVGVAHAIV
jgi:hypothetical protein